MDVAQSAIERIPARNLRVSRAEFAALWRAAEAFHDDRVRRHVGDWYGTGVVMTCRWLAGATVRPADGRPYLAFAPVTQRSPSAYEELIEAELFAAERLALRRPIPDWLAKRDGWLDAVIATLNWAWRRSGPAPLPVDQPVVSA